MFFSARQYQIQESNPHPTLTQPHPTSPSFITASSPSFSSHHRAYFQKAHQMVLDMFEISVWNQSNRFVYNISNRSLVQPQIFCFLLCHSSVSPANVRHQPGGPGMSGLWKTALTLDA